jgi:hypothetical protein
MEKDKIQEDINIILEGNLQRTMGFRSGKMVVPYPDKTVELLHKLSERLRGADRDYFWEVIIKPFNKEYLPIFAPLNKSKEQKVISNIHNNFGGVFEFLIKVGKIDAILEFFQQERNIDYKTVAILYKTRELLNNKYAGFTREILTKIEDYAKRLVYQMDKELRYEEALRKYEIDIDSDSQIVAINGVALNEPIKPTNPKPPRGSYFKAEYADIQECGKILQDIVAKVKLSKLDILEKEYEGINLEINQDQESLKATIKEFGFNPALNDSLNKITNKLNEARDDFDFKSCIDLVRAFLNELCVSISLTIEQKTSIRHSETIKDMGQALAYFNNMRIKFLAESEHKFLIMFNGFISNTGVHSLKSQKEHARIARNFVVEFGLFLVRRLQKYLDDFKK